jgi:hypothetical protein
LTTKKTPISLPSAKSTESNTKINPDTKTYSSMSGPSKAPISVPPHSEKSPPPNSSKMPTESPAKPLNKPISQKKAKTNFSAQPPLKIKRSLQAQKPEGQTLWRRRKR